MTTTDLHPIFADCCYDEETRYSLQKPVIRNGILFATDGRILVWMKTDQPDTPDKAPNIDDIINRPSSKGGDWHDLPETDYVERKCEACSGTGEGCCSKCGQEIACEECNGLGGSVPIAMKLADDWGISSKYVSLLRKHGVTRVRVNSEPNKIAAYHFELGEITGVLMPMELNRE